ncbi:MAG: hypothetical protein RR066_08320 [Mucinivorans sp.]
METINIKELWAQASPRNLGVDTEEIITKKHCRIITKYISDSRMKAVVCFCAFIVVSLLFMYAFLLLKLSMSLHLAAPLIIAGVFLFLRFIVEWRKYVSLQKDYDHYNTTKSEKLITAKIKRIKIIDFISYIVLFYSISIVLFVLMHNDKFLKDEFGWIIWVLIIILLGLPWLIHYSPRR